MPVTRPPRIDEIPDLSFWIFCILSISSQAFAALSMKYRDDIIQRTFSAIWYRYFEFIQLFPDSGAYLDYLPRPCKTFGGFALLFIIAISLIAFWQKREEKRCSVSLKNRSVHAFINLMFQANDVYIFTIGVIAHIGIQEGVSHDDR